MKVSQLLQPMVIRTSPTTKTGNSTVYAGHASPIGQVITCPKCRSITTFRKVHCHISYLPYSPVSHQ